ncbi:TonB-dependent receptor [Paludibacter jiangxiensis]|uniref:TonB-linked outer membrane protein, SusC/RagA family n=1 Tax=Paludibacter jiangxiensis TaxID=681398 RepID=A0A161LDI0_9BACT|nr:TonB-dependent receptor [Paludibacter jiangxiensis]GAT62007.1 TonB-linked outer membrane protein, SusC/RagA family [Paludibacter jiangxiensis]
MNRIKKHLYRLLLCTLFVSFAAVSFAQITFSAKNQKIRQVIHLIEKNSNYSFFYNNDLPGLDKTITINAKNQDVESILKQIFQGTGISYKIDSNKQIVLTTGGDNHETNGSPGAVSSKSQRIIGTIVDANTGDPLIGVNIVIAGTRNGVITDIDGRFSMEVPFGGVLDCSYVGYIPKKVNIGKQSQLKITLDPDVKKLEEVVVVGYGTQKKVNLTGSVASITATEIANKPVSNTSQALAGLVPGLSVVQSSGRPGASASVNLRGTGTFSSAGTAPLVLIDGTSGNIDDVDPNDIQSISFLKDAASASIYGNRAANGVILIETKKGAEGKTVISYNNSFGWQKPTELPDFLSSWQYASYYNEAMANMGKSAAYTDAQIQKFKDGSDPDNYPNVNHLKWLLNSGSGFQQKHNLGVQGGNSSLSYNCSANYMHQAGMTEKTSNDRYNILWNMNANILKGLTLKVNLDAYTTTYNSPNGQPSSIEGIIGYAVREGPIYSGKKADGTFGYQDNYSPEAWLSSESFTKNISTNIIGNTQLVWQTPVDGLTITGKAGINYNNNYNKSFIAQTYFDASKTVGPASLSVTSDNATYRSFEGLVNYKKQFHAHSINLLAGASSETYTYKNLYGYRNTFPNNYLYELNAGSGASASNSGYLSEWGLMSFFGRANYSLMDKYLFEANVRYDGSSRFAPSHRWGVFPSFSAGWRISEEKFWEKASLSDIVNNLKLRASWGVLGNQNIGTYPYQQTYSLGENAVLGSTAALTSGTRITTYNNPDITWETTSVADAGLDFSLFKGKITANVDYFYKYTYNILSSVQYTSIMGRSVGQSNVGAVSNKGFEVNLTYNGNIGKDFKYSINPNFTYVKNAVEKLADGAKQDLNNGLIVGQPIGIIYGYKTNGLFVNQSEIDAAPTQLVSKSSLKPGYIEYKDLNGDNSVDANNDRTVIGCRTPKYYYGVTLNASFKGFDLSALFQGLGGYQRLIGSYMAYAYYNGGQIQQWQVDNRWTTANPNKWAKYPRLETLNMNNPNLQTSDYWIRNASFLRIKNIQIGYTIPQTILHKIGLQYCRIYVSGENLYNFNSFYKGWDPENQIGTGDAPSYYPINSVFSFGCNIKI